LRPYDELHGVARRWERTRQARHRDAETVTLCAALAAELRAGLPPAAALASVAGDLPLLGVRLEPAARAVGRGASLADELAVVAAGERCPRLAAVAAVCAAGESTGAGIADVLDRLGRGFAGDDESAAELAALAAGPRATAVVLAGLPVMAVALGSALGLAPLRILLHTALGMGLWLAAGLLEAAGIVWVRRITTRALRA
jgi:tight adherence protein B